MAGKGSPSKLLGQLQKENRVIKDLLGYKGKELIRIIAVTKTGAIAQYEYVDRPGMVYMPLIENGKNVDKFVIVGEQLSLLEGG